MDGDLFLWPLWPQPKREMLLGVVYPGSPTAPHYLSIGQLADFITAGGITLPLSISDGGTGQVTAAEALAALGGAPIVSPAFGGNPTAPTQAAGDSSTRIATTAFVAATASSPSWDNVTNKPASFPPTLPIPQSGVTGLVGDLAQKAPLASPVFTGNPQAPTPAPGDSDTSIATTAFVAASLSALPPASSVTVSDTAPASPAPGDLWFDSASANLFVRYADPNTTQWVVAVNQPGPQGPTGETGPAGPAGQTWTVGTGLTLAANTISLTTPALPLAGGTLTGKLTVNSSNLLLGAGATGYITRPAGTDNILLSNEAGTNLAQIGLIATTTYTNAALTVFGAQQNWDGIVVGSATGGNKGVGTLNATGVYANNVLLTSDARAKTDIEPLPPGCLDLVRAIEPVSFRWRQPSAALRAKGMPEPPPIPFEPRTQWGFLAQDVAKVIDTAVVSDAVGVGDLIATLWKAVQELSAKVVVLEAKL